MSNNRGSFILSTTIAAPTEEDRAYIQRAFEVFALENPTLDFEMESLEGRILISAEDELQLEAACNGILAGRALEIGELRIAYRETIRKVAEAEGKYIRQTGGSGNYGHCKLRIEPNEPGKGYEFINEIKGGSVPREYIKPIDQGVQGALELGILAGYPIVDVKVILFDGSSHEVDSNEMAFKFAGSIAFKEAARKASPVLLEPVMAVEVTVPEEHMGTIIRDINSRRGRISNLVNRAGSQLIYATVPLAEVLRSSAHGRPRYTLRFAGYEVAPSRDGDGGDGTLIFARRPGGPRPGKGFAVEWDS